MWSYNTVHVVIHFTIINLFYLFFFKIKYAIKSSLTVSNTIHCFPISLIQLTPFVCFFTWHSTWACGKINTHIILHMYFTVHNAASSWFGWNMTGLFNRGLKRPRVSIEYKMISSSNHPNLNFSDLILLQCIRALLHVVHQLNSCDKGTIKTKLWTFCFN